MLHLFSFNAVSQCVSLYLNSAAEFRRLFPSGMTDSFLEEWRVRMAADPPEVRLSNVLIKPETINGLISISLVEETAEEQTLGGHMGDDTVGCFLTQVVEMRILAKEEFIVTALHQIIKAAMYRAQLGFIEAAGVTQMDYDGASGLALEGEQRAEELGLHVRFAYFKFLVPDKFPLSRVGSEEDIIESIDVRMDTYG